MKLNSFGMYLYLVLIFYSIYIHIHMYCHPQIMPKVSPSLIEVSLEFPWNPLGVFLKSSQRMIHHHYDTQKSSWNDPFDFTWNYTIYICCLQSKCLNHLWFTSRDLVTWLHLNNASLLSIDPKWPPKCNTKFQSHVQWGEIIFEFES